jgi:predicted PurR-regulated permease PerM
MADHPPSSGSQPEAAAQTGPEPENRHEIGVDRQGLTDDDHPLVIRMPVDVRNVALTVIAVVAAILFLRLAAPVLIPIVLGVLLSYVLSPFVNALERGRLPRALGSALVLVLTVAAIAGGVYTLSGQAMAVVESVPEAAQRVRARIQERQRQPGDGALEKVQRAATEIDQAAEEASATRAAPQQGVQRVQVVEPSFRAIDYVWSGGVGLAALIAQLTVVLFLVYFILLSGDLYKRKLVKIVGPTLTQKKITVQILDDINLQIGQFLRVQVIANLVVAVVTALVLWLLGVEQYIVWGLLAGLFNSIPYVGPVAVTAGLGIVAFLQFDDLGRTLYVCAAVGAITGLEGMLLRPALLSRASRMNAVAIFLSLLFWTWVWGLWGTIFAVPIIMMMKATCDRIEALQPIGELLGAGDDA